jgi:heme-degrading monooxygenase HmoA
MEKEAMQVILFRSKLTDEAGADYQAMNAELELLVKENPGFVGHKSYLAEDGERLTVVWWRDEESLRVWRNLPRHREAQATGRKLWYRYYRMDVAAITRSYEFVREQSGTSAAQNEGCDESPRELMEELQNFPRHLRTIAQGVPASQLQRRPANGGFSMVEHACHLRDYEIEGVLGRIQKILAEQCPSLPEYEGEKLAAERNYQMQDFAAAVEDFERHRLRTLEMLNTLSGEQMEQSATIGTMGVVTIRKLVEIVAEHDQSHRREIEELLAEIQARV